MTLSRWFRDYVYLPLGGNRAGSIRTYVNLFAVFVLTGFWHGASWTFMAWGVWHGLFMILGNRPFPARGMARPLHHAARLCAAGRPVRLGSSFAPIISASPLACSSACFCWGIHPAEHVVGEFASPVAWITLAVAVALSTPIHGAIRERLSERSALALGVPVIGGLFIIACMKVLSGADSPFLYFRF